MILFLPRVKRQGQRELAVVVLLMSCNVAVFYCTIRGCVTTVIAVALCKEVILTGTKSTYLLHKICSYYKMKSKFHVTIVTFKRKRKIFIKLCQIQAKRRLLVQLIFRLLRHSRNPFISLGNLIFNLIH